MAVINDVEGGGVIDRLRSLRYDVFKGAIQRPRHGSAVLRGPPRRDLVPLREWLAVGAVPKDKELAIDLTNAE